MLMRVAYKGGYASAIDLGGCEHWILDLTATKFLTCPIVHTKNEYLFHNRRSCLATHNAYTTFILARQPSPFYKRTSKLYSRLQPWRRLVDSYYSTAFECFRVNFNSVDLLQTPRNIFVSMQLLAAMCSANDKLPNLRLSMPDISISVSLL